MGAVAAVLLLSACAAPMVQAPLTPPAGFAGPRIEDRALVVRDGARLSYLRWSPDGPPRAVVVALHGMNDTYAAFRLAGPWWAEHGVETWAYDQRGFGRSPGKGVWAGETAMTDDLRDVTALVRAARPGVPVIVVGESMGGSVAIAAFASDDPPDADRVLPGDGDIGLDLLVHHLRQIGYTGCVSVELMNPQIWRIPPLQFGEVAMTALRKLLGQASMG